MRTAAFPNAAVLAKEVAHLSAGAVPVPPPPAPFRSKSTSHRIRQRYAGKLEVWKIATAMTAVINGLNEGGTYFRRPKREATGANVNDESSRSLASRKVSQGILERAAWLARERRGLVLTGAQSAVSQLLKVPMDATGYLKAGALKAKQVPLIAMDILEPLQSRPVDMLACLPAEDASFYSQERHVVELSSKSSCMFREIENQYMSLLEVQRVSVSSTGKGKRLLIMGMGHG